MYGFIVVVLRCHGLLCAFRCGLAEQLDRLLSQQRSEKTLWHHQMLRQDNHGNKINIISLAMCESSHQCFYLTPL